jgi:hypothetical protein
MCYSLGLSLIEKKKKGKERTMQDGLGVLENRVTIMGRDFCL